MGSIRSPTSRRARQDRLPTHKTASTNSCRIFGGRQTSQPSRRRLPDSHRDHWLRGCTSSVGRLRTVDDPFILDVGDLTDISRILPLSEMRLDIAIPDLG